MFYCLQASITFVTSAGSSKFGSKFGSSQLDEVSDASSKVDVSAVSQMYREREDSINAASKAMEEQARSFKKHRGRYKRLILIKATVIYVTIRNINVKPFENTISLIYFQIIGLEFH